MAEATFEITMSVKDQQIAMEYLLSHIDEIIEEMWKNTVHVAYDKAKEISENAVNTFYSEGPGSGGRTGDLMDAFDIGIKDGYMLSFELGPDLMSGYHHQGADFVYENSFVRGYHGGSAGTDKNEKSVSTPHYRVPAPIFSSWGGAAPRSTSPHDTIVNKWNIFNESVFKPLQYKELVKILSEIRERLGV